MKIRINDIPRDGLELTENQDAGALDLARDDVRFVSPIAISAFITRDDKDSVYARISTKGKLEVICARCLSPYGVDFKREFDLNYEIKGKTTLDLTEDIRQEIILEYPLKPLCRQDCKGLCQVCGKKLNEGPCGHKADPVRWNKIEKGSDKEE